MKAVLDFDVAEVNLLLESLRCLRRKWEEYGLDFTEDIHGMINRLEGVSFE